MKLNIYPDYVTLSRATADSIATVIQKKPNAVICIASGHTPMGVFQCLVEDVRGKHLDISQCTFVGLDEWIGVDKNDPGSCWSMMYESFFKPLNISDSKIVFFNTKVVGLEEECERINRFIAQHGLDVMLVGIGLNGHIAMNEPGTSFDSYAHVSQLAEDTKQVGQKYFTQQTELHSGMTLGLKHLREAKLPILMANGERKASIIKKAITTSPTEEIPATVIQLIPQAWVVVDKEVAKELGVLHSKNTFYIFEE